MKIKKVDKILDFRELQTIQLVNLFTFLAVITSLFYFFIFFSDSVYLSSMALSFSLLLSLTWLWAKKRKDSLVKIWLYSFSYIFLFWLASVLGRTAGIQLMFIIVLFSGIVLFEVKEKKYLIFNIGLCILSFLALEITDYKLFKANIPQSTITHGYYGSLALAIFAAICIALLYALQYNQQLNKTQKALDSAKEIEKTIHYFSNSLYGKNTVDEIFWDVVKNCVGHLGFEDCVIYILDKETQLLKQRAAYGDKNLGAHEIYKPIDIPVGEGIVGYVAKTSTALLVNDTSKDARYITDDRKRFSEIAVPIIVKNELIGVIDSEHPERNFYNIEHLNALNVISVLCANKIAGALAEEEREKALRSKLLAEQLKEIETLRTKLFTNISHELRTPLTLMMGTIEDQESENFNDSWGLMKSQTDKLLRLINQLLDLSKFESGKFQLRLETNCIYTFIKVQLKHFSSFAKSNGIQIESSIPEGALYIKYDEDAMDNIISNLLSNAIKYSTAGNKVAFSIAYDNEYLQIEVKDYGVGIYKKDLPKIFNRFYQASNTVGLGTGLGLALTKELVELYGGQIYAKSTINKGSTFTVKIPFKSEVATIPISPSSLSTSLSIKSMNVIADEGLQTEFQNQYILVVEDNVALGEMIVDKLKSTYKVTHVLDGESGLEEAKKTLPDLIISDIMMERMNGIELCSQLKKDDLTSHIPVILLTAKTDAETKILGLHTGADDYLLKPFNSAELKARIKNLLKQRKLLKAKYQKVIALSPNDTTVTDGEEVFIKKIIAIIEQNLDDNGFGATQLCEALNMSRMQLHRKITSLTEYSTSSFIRYIRLQRARDILKAGETVTQTAYKVGFNSLSYFSTAFKEQFGTLPSECI